MKAEDVWIHVAERVFNLRRLRSSSPAHDRMADTQPAPVFTAALHDVRYFANILRGVQFSSRAVITLSEVGMRVSVERAKVLTADAYMTFSIFDEHKYAPPPDRDDEDLGACFEIPLLVLVESLNMFGSGFASTAPSSQPAFTRADSDSELAQGQGRIDHFFARKDKDGKRTGMRMNYAGEGHPLILHLSEDAAGPHTTCKIKTLVPDDMATLDFDDDRKVAKIIMRSSWLRDALSELEAWSCRDITFVVTPSVQPTSTRPTGTRATAPTARQSPQPTLRIRADGAFGSTEMDYPNDREVLEMFECAEEVVVTYKFSHVANCLQALRSSSKTSLRIDDEGVLSLQFMMPTTRSASGTSTAFIEFRCLPLEDATA